MRAQGFDLRGEQKRTTDRRVIDRTYPEAIARKKQAPAPLVPNRERPLTVELLDARLTLLLVQVENHLGVGLSRETVTPGLQPLAQLEVVENLAVERDP